MRDQIDIRIGEIFKSCALCGALAWFTATNNASLAGAKAETVAVSQSTKTVGITFDVIVSVSAVKTDKGTVGQNNVAVSSEMELVTYDSGAKFGYYVGDEANPRYQTTQFDATNDYWRLYKVDLAFRHEDNQQYQTQDNQNYTDAEMFAILANKQFALKVGRTADSNSIARFHSATSTDSAIASGQSQDLTFQVAQDVNLTNFGKSYYFGMYVDGTDHTKDATNATGNFTVTMVVTDKPAQQQGD